MAEENKNENSDANGGTENGSESGSHKRKIVMLLMPILLVIGAVVGVYFSGITDSLFVPSGETVSSSGDGEDSPEVIEEGRVKQGSAFFYDVPEILVNLSGKPGQKPVYFKVKVSLELENPQDAPKIDLLLPRVIDSMQFYLREMRIEELQGSMGTYRLKEELLGRLNRVLAPTRINEVLLKDVLIQ